jgi:hypothetical protein
MKSLTRACVQNVPKNWQNTGKLWHNSENGVQNSIAMTVQ